MNTEANWPALIGYVILYCKLCKGFEFLYVIWELCTKYPKLRVLSARDRIKSRDENSIQETKKRIKLVFSPKLVCTVVSSPDLDLPSTCIHCCWLILFIKSKSCQKNFLQILWTDTQFHLKVLDFAHFNWFSLKLGMKQGLESQSWAQKTGWL